MFAFQNGFHNEKRHILFLKIGTSAPGHQILCLVTNSRYNGSTQIAKFHFETISFVHQICLVLATEQHVFLFVCHTKRV